MNVSVADWTNPYAGSAQLESIVSHTDDLSISVQPGTRTFRADLHTSAGQVRLEGGSVRFGTWQHVALVFDERESMARLFVDGVLVDQRDARGSLVITPGIPLRIGTWFEQNQAFSGAIDNLLIRRRASTLNEVAESARSPRLNP